MYKKNALYSGLWQTDTTRRPGGFKFEVQLLPDYKEAMNPKHASALLELECIATNSLDHL